MANNLYQGMESHDLKTAVLKRQAQAMAATPGATQRLASTDAAQNLPDALIKDANGNYASCAIITCETNDVRYSMGTTVPTQGATGVGHVLAKDTGQLILTNPEEVRNFRFLSKVAATAGAIQVTVKW